MEMERISTMNISKIVPYPFYPIFEPKIGIPVSAKKTHLGRRCPIQRIATGLQKMIPGVYPKHDMISLSLKKAF